MSLLVGACGAEGMPFLHVLRAVEARSGLLFHTPLTRLVAERTAAIAGVNVVRVEVSDGYDAVDIRAVARGALEDIRGDFFVEFTGGTKVMRNVIADLLGGSRERLAYLHRDGVIVFSDGRRVPARLASTFTLHAQTHGYPSSAIRRVSTEQPLERSARMVIERDHGERLTCFGAHLGAVPQAGLPDLRGLVIEGRFRPCVLFAEPKAVKRQAVKHAALIAAHTAWQALGQNVPVGIISTLRAAQAIGLETDLRPAIGHGRKIWIFSSTEEGPWLRNAPSTRLDHFAGLAIDGRDPDQLALPRNDTSGAESAGPD